MVSPFKEEEKIAVDEEITKLLDKEVIALSEHEEGQFLSDIFTKEKKVEYVVKRHFKMDSFETARAVITQDCYMASLDLRDAYYSVPIAECDRKFFKFCWNNQLYNFKALANGLSSGPRLFTKLLEPPLSKLRSMGHVITAYIDDSLLVGLTEEKASKAVQDTAKLLEALGFIIHPEKSVFTPRQEIEYLGFKIDSKKMTVTLPTARKLDVKMVCDRLLGDD